MRLSLMSSGLLSMVLAACSAQAQQPAYPRDQGPVVLLDAKYRNLLALRLRPSLIETFTHDGYRVIEREGEVTERSLQDVKIMVSASPVSEQNALPTELPPATEAELAAQVDAAWRLPTPSAYSASEIQALVDWVNRGGALLVIVDHMPFPGAVQELTMQFGFELANGHALAANEEGRSRPVRFSRSDGSLADHVITAGRNAAERIEAIETYGGAAFRLSADGMSLMTFGSGYEQLLPNVAWKFTADTPRELISGWSQGGVVQAGRGRVAVFTEAGFFMAPPPDESGSDIRRQNHQFLLNVAHWLSDLLN
jgi:hypothetical protein